MDRLENEYIKKREFRPFILFGSIPLAIATVLTFLNLDIVENGKIAYAFATYMLFGLAYSVVNIPYGSLASVMTKDPVERASLASFRTIGSQVALLITGVAVIPIVMKFSDPETGYVVAVIAMVLLGIVLAAALHDAHTPIPAISFGSAKGKKEPTAKWTIQA